MIHTHSNFSRKIKESNYKPSVTVPDKTLSLRDMITRYQTGGRVKSFEPSYLGAANVIPVGFERMDLMQRAELLKSLPHFIADSRGRLSTMRMHIEKAMKQAEAQAKREEYLALKAEFDKPEE